MAGAARLRPAEAVALSLRPFERAHLHDAALRLPMPCVGFTLFLEEEPLAVAGLTVLKSEDGQAYQFAFLHIQDDRARRHAVALFRAACGGLAAAGAGGVDTVYSLLDEDKPRAAALLTRLGFAPLEAEAKSQYLVALEARTQQQTWIMRTRKGP